MKAVFDSDVLVDYLQGSAKAKQELGRYVEKAVSIVSWMEIMIGARSGEEERTCRAFLGSFTVLPVSADVAEEAVRLRRETRIRLPDAIIWATARAERCLLVTRNTGDFPKSDPSVRFPYSAP